MIKTKKIISSLIIILIIVFVGGSIMCILNPNNRKQYKIYEENGKLYYKNYLSNEKIWLAYNDELALIHEYKTVWGRTYIDLNIWKYVNPEGNVVLQPKIYIADAFSEGLAAAIPMEGQNWGYINIDGNIIIEPQYSRASMFKNGVASVFIEDDGGKWILINIKGDHLQELNEPLNWESHTQADPKNDALK